MRQRFPHVALLWMYQGRNPKARLRLIEEFNYPEFRVIEVVNGHGWGSAVREVPKAAKVCIFWIDDGRPITEDFIEQMTLPITAPREDRLAMHFKSGQAMSVAKSVLDKVYISEDAIPTTSLLKLLLPVLDVAEKSRGRVHVAFASSEERKTEHKIQKTEVRATRDFGKRRQNTEVSDF